jgi:outer membrane protein assembly factor BamB
MDNHALLRSCTFLGAATLFGALTLTASGCSTTSSGSNSASENSQPSADTEWDIDHAAFKELGFQWDWSGYPPLQKNAELVHATAYHDVVVAQGSGATLSVLDANTGKIRWSMQVDRPTTYFFEPVRFGETLYIASETDLYEVNLKNGNTLDQDSLQTVVSTPPAIIDNIAVFGTSTGELFGFQMDQDFKLWSYKFDGPINTRAIEVDDEYVAALSEGGDLRTIRVKSAESGAVMRIAGGSTTDILTDGFAFYVGSSDQSIYSFSSDDGYRFWRERSSAPITIQPVLHDGILYVTTEDAGLCAMDSETGEYIWQNQSLGGWAVGLRGGDELIIWTGLELVSVDAERGDILSRVPLPNIAGVRTDMFENGNLYIIAFDGRIAKFSPR